MFDTRPNPSLTSARSSPLEAAILGMYSSASSRQTSGVRKQALSPTDCINLPTFTPNTLLIMILASRTTNLSLTCLDPFSDLLCPLHASDETHEQYRPRKVLFGLTGTQIDWLPLVRQRYLRFYSPV